MSRWVRFEFLTPVVLFAYLSSQLFLHFYEDLCLFFTSNFLLLGLLFHIDLRLLQSFRLLDLFLLGSLFFSPRDDLVID
jgi:hypothetical protein